MRCARSGLGTSACTGQQTLLPRMAFAYGDRDTASAVSWLRMMWFTALPPCEACVEGWGHHTTSHFQYAEKRGSQTRPMPARAEGLGAAGAPLAGGVGLVGEPIAEGRPCRILHRQLRELAL